MCARQFLWHEHDRETERSYKQICILCLKTIATYEMLDDFFSPEIHDGKITRSIIYYVVVYCEEMKQRVTATELFSGQMASGSSWVGSASGKLDINDITQKKYCD